jgi:hypothetical protein
VAALVREAVDQWLAGQGVQPIPEDEWQSRFSALLDRRARIAEEQNFSQDEIERDVMEAVREVRHLLRTLARTLPTVDVGTDIRDRDDAPVVGAAIAGQRTRSSRAILICSTTPSFGHGCPSVASRS